MIFRPANIMLPDFSRVDGEKWAVIACDQFTSEKEYWKNVEDYVGDAPSTRELIFPEVYLENGYGNLETIRKIHKAMHLYRKKLLNTYKNSLILVKRTLSDGRVRTGLVGEIDLECYDYSGKVPSPIRATEGTVLSRIPPRVQIREGAELELPHVLLLMDDGENPVLSPLDSNFATFPLAYRFPLMQNGGRIEGRFLPEKEMGEVLARLARLEMRPLAYAVGDGNHSLATAKACYESYKAEVGAEKAGKSPLRYALVELESIYDEAICFHPIYRVMFHVNPKELLAALPTGCGEMQTFHYIAKDMEGDISLPKTAKLPVGTLQKALDDYLATHREATIDYIHGEDSLATLSRQENAIGFLFSGMEKEELFPAVLEDGALPRKTFSMGEAVEKRYYLEARSLV